MNRNRFSFLLVVLLLAVSVGLFTAAVSAQDGELEIFSWWTAGGEVEALNAIYEIYSREYPNVEIVNAALAGGQGQGGNMKALLETRMLGGEPPDSFQVHLGRELTDSPRDCGPHGAIGLVVRRRGPV